MVNVAFDSVHHSNPFQLAIVVSYYAGIENIPVPLATQGFSILTLLHRGRNVGFTLSEIIEEPPENFCVG